MSTWTGKTQGTALGYLIFIYFIKWFGIAGGYFLLRFVSFYFYLFVGEKKQVLQDFYTQYLGYSKSESKKLIQQNFILIGQSIIDKIALLIGKGKNISYTENGEHYLQKLVQDNQGAILISGHLGNWDVAGNLLKNLDANVSVVMYQNEHQQIQALLESVGSVPKFNIIPIKEDISHVFEIYNALKKGHLVCIHADRFLPNTQTITLPFLDSPAKFPLGPFQLIEKFKVPYSFVFATKETKYGYHFTATKPALTTLSASEIASHFVLLFEEKVKQNPEQWFNYYKFHN